MDRIYIYILDINIALGFFRAIDVGTLCVIVKGYCDRVGLALLTCDDGTCTVFSSLQ